MDIKLGCVRLEFRNHAHWVNKAKSWFEKLTSQQIADSVCVDAAVRICRIGGDFEVADKEGTFPVTVYAIREDVE